MGAKKRLNPNEKPRRPTDGSLDLGVLRVFLLFDDHCLGNAVLSCAVDQEVLWRPVFSLADLV